LRLVFHSTWSRSFGRRSGTIFSVGTRPLALDEVSFPTALRDEGDVIPCEAGIQGGRRLVPAPVVCKIGE